MHANAETSLRPKMKKPCAGYAQGLERSGYTVLLAAMDETPWTSRSFIRADRSAHDRVVMPVMGGPQLVDCLLPLRPGTRNPVHVGLPVGLIARAGVSAEGRRSSKPFTIGRLVSEVRAVLDTASLTKNSAIKRGDRCYAVFQAGESSAQQTFEERHLLFQVARIYRCCPTIL